MNVIRNAMAILNLDSTQETLLYALKDMAEQEFCDYCHRDNIPAEAESLIVKMVLTLYNKREAMGINSQSFSGISETFIDGYSQDIKKQLNRYRKLTLV